MSLPTIEPLPDENESLPPARRRRQRRMIVPPGSSDRDEFLQELSLRTVPSFDFFLFSLLSGITLGAGLLLDAPALFFLAALLAPFMAPAIGIALGTITGSVRFVLQSLIGLAIGSLIVFISGMLAGWAATMLPERIYLQASFHSQFSWPGFLILALGAGMAGYLIVRAPHTRPLVASVAIAYGLYLPIGTAGFGLISGASGLWPNGLFLFLLHLIWAALFGTLVLAMLGLRPLNAAGYLLGILYASTGIAAIALTFSAPPQITLPAALQQPTEEVSSGYVTLQPSATPTQTFTVTPSPTPVPPTATATPTRTLIPSLTPSLTITPVPTPIWAKIYASGSNGALIRAEPSYDSTIVQSLLNDTLVEVLPDSNDNSGGTTWVHVRTSAGKEGWIVRSLLRTATPAAGE
jgi:uncharacterized membrane protein